MHVKLSLHEIGLQTLVKRRKIDHGKEFVGNPIFFEDSSKFSIEVPLIKHVFCFFVRREGGYRPISGKLTDIVFYF